MAPFALFHYTVLNLNGGGGLAQFELMTDLAAVQGALFAIVYRYAIRADTNPMLNQGVLGAFVLVRTLPSIRVSSGCSALPLQCKSLLIPLPSEVPGSFIILIRHYAF